MQNKTAIIFPGVGYHTDKPLLYFGKKLVKELGYRLIEISYGGFQPNLRGNADKMQQAFLSAYDQAKEILKDYTFSPDEELLLISKSVGTVVAAAWQQEQGIKARNIYFTPVEATFRYTRPCSGIAFHGTADPWVATSIVEACCREQNIPLYMTPEANHSLETGNISRDIETLGAVMQACRTYLTGRKTVRVVAAVMRDGEKVFATARGYGTQKGGWEFPGGKIEPGESPQQALKREIMEELNVEIEVGERIETIEYDYPDFHLSMDCFWSVITGGELMLKEAQEARWLSRDQMDSVNWLPADIQLIEKIKAAMTCR